MKKWQCQTLGKMTTQVIIDMISCNSFVNIFVLGLQCIFAAQTLVHRVGSRTAKENLDVFLEAWRGLVRDLLTLTTQCGNICKEPKAVRMGYMSLPRPGVSGESQSYITLEMKV